MQLNILGTNSSSANADVAVQSGDPSVAELSAESFNTLEEVSAIASMCLRCDLCKNRNNVVVFRGKPEARIMIIGEAPGLSEDQSGLPFVGKAGQLLDKILASAGLDSEKDVYVCQVIKCRPPGNRAPTAKEVEKCRPFLEAQISLVKPELILLAGTTAVLTVLKATEPISKIRGQWFEHPSGARVMPVFHPSYLLRHDSREVGSPKWLMWQDIKEVKRALDEIMS